MIRKLTNKHTILNNYQIKQYVAKLPKIGK